MAGEGWSGSFWVEGEPSGPNAELPHGEYAVALPGYFHTMRIPLLAGRDFTAADVRGIPKVVIVDETLARKHWGANAQTAVGKRLNPNGDPGDWATVIGVVGHVHSHGPQEAGEAQIYQPMLQRPQTVMAVVVRSGSSPALLAPALRDAAHAVDRDLPVNKMRTMDDVVTSVIARQRFNMLMLAVFAAAALVLATVGLYGVMSYLVSQRTREIGIRIALGGQPSDVRTMVVRESLLIAVTGVVIGTVVSVALSRFVSGLLFGIAATDWTTYGSVALLLLVVSLGAAYGPARRATRIDPVRALRE
jgi:putative ABC transport system permease protein